MKTKIVLFLIVCFACFSVTLAQEESNYGLILRGRMYDGEREDYPDHVVWKARLAMELVNTGIEPIILINPGKEFPQWQTDVKFWDSANDGFLFSKSIKRPQKSDEELKILTEFLAGNEPPPNQFVIIRPNETLTFEDNLEVEQKFTMDKEGYSPRWEGTIVDSKSYKVKSKYFSYGTAPASSLKYLQIKYEYSLLKYQINVDLLEILQDRWRDVGYLPVNVNGGFSITSKPIDNNINYKMTKK